jgi:hypothetical protein
MLDSFWLLLERPKWWNRKSEARCQAGGRARPSAPASAKRALGSVERQRAIIDTRRRDIPFEIQSARRARGDHHVFHREEAQAVQGATKIDEASGVLVVQAAQRDDLARKARLFLRVACVGIHELERNALAVEAMAGFEHHAHAPGADEARQLVGSRPTRPAPRRVLARAGDQRGRVGFPRGACGERRGHGTSHEHPPRVETAEVRDASAPLR